MNIADQAKQQKIALNAILAEIQEQLNYFQGSKFYTDTSVQTHEIISRLKILRDHADKGLKGVTIPTADDYNSGKKLEDFCRGYHVNVHARSNDPFKDFSGVITEINWVDKYLVVRHDEFGNSWICEPSQCSFSSDDVMHGD